MAIINDLVGVNHRHTVGDRKNHLHFAGDKQYYEGRDFG